jgi:hypothetical protein
LNDVRTQPESGPDAAAPASPAYPSLYQINTRVRLSDLSASLGRRASLDDIPDAELDAVAAMGFDWVWLLSVWRTGPAGQKVSRSDPDLRREFLDTLPDLREEDIGGSGFAITAYEAHPDLGGDEALARIRERLRRRGLRLMLDFVPNHTALDHPWVETRPDFYVQGTELELARAPKNYTWVRRSDGDRLLAHGRDPYFPGWQDTLQLDYGNPALQDAMVDELEKVAGRCDGARCDMAMLVLPEVFERTWGRRADPFWPRAIRRVRARDPSFVFMAEAYWDLEWSLLQQGFDYAYDKRLYDRLRAVDATSVRQHLSAGLDYQNRLARFLENHDEPRAAVTFLPGQHEAAAIVTYFTPGLRFFHQGQLKGRRKRISPHLVRAPDEAPDPALQRFYAELLQVIRQPVFRAGAWRLLNSAPAWDGNWTNTCIIAWCWEGSPGQKRLIAVNFAPHQSQGYVPLPWPDLAPAAARLEDLVGPAVYEREGLSLLTPGLYLDLPPWGRHVFDVTAAP